VLWCRRSLSHEQLSHLHSAKHARPTRRVLDAFDEMPHSAADCTHAKSATNIVDDAVWARLPSMVH
jgi:hypothetical protein